MRYIHFQTAVNKAEITLTGNNNPNKSTAIFKNVAVRIVESLNEQPTRTCKFINPKDLHGIQRTDRRLRHALQRRRA